MAIDIGNESLALTIKERTVRTEIFTEFGTDPIVRVHRERVWLSEDGSLHHRDPNWIVTERTLSQVADVTVEDITGAQLAVVIAAWADHFRQEDLGE